MHFKNVHEANRKQIYDCDICRLQFKKKKDLKDHIIGLHGEEKWITYTEINYEFSKNEHMFIEIDLSEGIPPGVPNLKLK